MGEKLQSSLVCLAAVAVAPVPGSSEMWLATTTMMWLDKDQAWHLGAEKVSFRKRNGLVVAQSYEVSLQSRCLSWVLAMLTQFRGSSWPEIKELFYKTLQKKRRKGKYNETLFDIQHHARFLEEPGLLGAQDTARLLLMQGKVLHAKAGTLLLKREKLHALDRASDAARKSLRIGMELCAKEELKDQSILADSLLLAANLAARLVDADDGSASPAEDKKKLKEARDMAERAWPHLHSAKMGKLHRVLGVVAQIEGNHGQAAERFALAIQAFEQAGEEDSIWCAVAYWNFHFALMELGEESKHGEGLKVKSLPFLKQATLLQESIEGKDHPYSKEYRFRLENLCVRLRRRMDLNQPLTEVERDDIKTIVDSAPKLAEEEPIPEHYFSFPMR